MSLHPTVPFAPGETPESFVSRLARVNGIPSAHRFCDDMGFRFEHVLAGRDEALLRVAELVGMDPAPLLREACVRSGRLWTLRGQAMARAGIVSGDLQRVCPACLRDDNAGAPRPDAAPYGRTFWRVVHLRACPVHGLAMFALPVAATDRRFERDFAANVAPFAGRFDALARAQVPRDPSTFEHYLVARLEGAVGTATWLDALPFYAAAKTCEMVGFAKLFGPHRKPTSLDGEDWHRSGAEGFLVATQGPAAVESLLADLCRAPARSVAAANGPQGRLGYLYAWLSGSKVDPVYDVLRDAMRRVLADTVPLAPGRKVLGEVPRSRKVHSVWSASREVGLGPARLRRLLVLAGHVAPGDRRSPSRTTFDAVAAADLLRRLCKSHNVLRLRSALNADRTQTKLLVDAGFLAPVVDEPASAAGQRLYAKEDVDAFLADLWRDARPVAAPPANAYRIPEAARRACCQSKEVVALVLERRLAWVGRLEGVHGFGAVLVDVDEVRQMVRGPELDGVPLRVACGILGTNWRVVRALVEHGVVLAHVRRHPAHRVEVPVIPHAELRRFAAEYVSLVDAARDRRVHASWLSGFLSERGVKPALARASFHATFYRRADVDGVAGEVLARS